MEPIESSETSASNTQTPGIYPKESELQSYTILYSYKIATCFGLNNTS
jgi:hypothetical protein